MHSPSAVFWGAVAQPIGNFCVSLLCINCWDPRRFSLHSISSSMSASTEINHTSPPSLGLNPSQGSLLPYTRSVVCLGQRKSSALWEPWQQQFNSVQWCCASLQSKLSMNSISDRSVRRTLSRLVIILPAGIRTADIKQFHWWWSLVGDFFRTASGKHLRSYCLHQTTTSEFYQLPCSLYGLRRQITASWGIKSFCYSF